MTSLFSKEAGWPYGEIRDDDPILEKQRAIEEPNPVRQVSFVSLSHIRPWNENPNSPGKTDIVVAEEAKKHGVKSVNIVVPYVCE